MITVTLKNSKYSVIEAWHEMSLATFITLAALPIPERLERLYLVSTALNGGSAQDIQEYEKAVEACTPQDYTKTFPEYYGKVLKVLSDIPADLINLMRAELRSAFYEDYLRPFVLSLIYNRPVINSTTQEKGLEAYAPPNIKHIEINKERFYFPKELKIYGEQVYLAKEPIVTFAEAADIDNALEGLGREGVKRLPMFVAVYCRKNGEKYDQDRVIKREALFNSATMAEVWALFFCIAQLLEKYSNNLAVFSKQILALLPEPLRKN